MGFADQKFGDGKANPYAMNYYGSFDKKYCVPLDAPVTMIVFPPIFLFEALVVFLASVGLQICYAEVRHRPWVADAVPVP